MENLEQENRELREEVYALKVGIANLTTLIESLVASQNQPPLVPPFSQPQQRMIASEGSSIPVSVTPVTTTQNCMPQGYPWGMP